MKKIDKLVFSSFIGPLILTFLVVLFILLMVNMLKYFDDIIGKDIGWEATVTLWAYFAVLATPGAMPLAVLLASLITFGNLGEHFELTAIKSLGVSLTRSIVPIFIFVIAFTGFAVYINNTLVPRAALEAYSLLYDIRQKKPALDIREGVFYNAIPDISIKVDQKFPDGSTLKDIIIYDYRSASGQREVTVADSGRMTSFLNNQFLRLELFNGYNYNERAGAGVGTVSNVQETFSQTHFGKTEVVFDLSSFSLIRTDKRWFQGNRIMRNLKELQIDMDSVKDVGLGQDYSFQTSAMNKMFTYHRSGDTIGISPELNAYKVKKDSTSTRTRAESGIRVSEGYPLGRNQIRRIQTRTDSLKYQTNADSVFKKPPTPSEYSSALVHARSVKSELTNYQARMESNETDFRVFQIQWHKVLANSIACLVMFLIGAPLGSIIKRGGIGIPVIVSILFFILFYVFGIVGEKWAKQGAVPVFVGIWGGNVILFLIGLFFLRQARADARLFDSDFYNVAWLKFKKGLTKAGILRSDPN